MNNQDEKPKSQDELDAIKISSAGWVQGSVFSKNDIALPFHYDSDNEFLIIATQSCSVVSQRFENDPFVEAMAARKLSEFNEKSHEASGKNQRLLHLKLMKCTKSCLALECDINRRTFFDRKKLLSLVPVSDFSIGERGSKKLANWIARHYTRIALPNDLIRNMKCQLLPKLEKIFKQNNNGNPLHCEVDSIYIAYQSQKNDDGLIFFTLKFIFLCKSQNVAEKLDIMLIKELNDFFKSTGTDQIFIDFIRCGNPTDTFLSDLEGYDRFSEWDYLTDLGEIKWYINAI